MVFFSGVGNWLLAKEESFAKGAVCFSFLFSMGFGVFGGEKNWIIENCEVFFVLPPL